MKKQVFLVAGLMAVLGAMPVMAATNFGARAASSADLTGGPATRTRTDVNYQKYQTRSSTNSYQAQDSKNLYYTQPTKRSDLYKQYDATNSGTTTTTTTVRTTRSETLRSELVRKYFLAHPFFQPLKGKFGSITDLSYNNNSYDLTLNQTVQVGGALALNGQKGSWNANVFSVKEDFSYGITDKFALMAMIKYDISKYKFDWDNYPSDSMNDNGMNVFGIGGQWRIVDNTEWIATASAYYQHQKDISNDFVLDFKAGYKVASSTIYGVARGWYLALDGNSYGNGLTSNDWDGAVATMYIPYKTDVDSAFFFEGGAGIFSVLDKDWTMNLEAVFGSYDWHNQASIKGAIGWQPNDWAALNLYVKTTVYDNADDKTLDLYWLEPDAGLNTFTRLCTVDLDKYSETSVGLQAIFMF